MLCLMCLAIFCSWRGSNVYPLPSNFCCIYYINISIGVFIFPFPFPPFFLAPYQADQRLGHIFSRNWQTEPDERGQSGQKKNNKIKDTKDVFGLMFFFPSSLTSSLAGRCRQWLGWCAWFPRHFPQLLPCCPPRHIGTCILALKRTAASLWMSRTWFPP